jgi:hypothetical protein
MEQHERERNLTAVVNPSNAPRDYLLQIKPVPLSIA